MGTNKIRVKTIMLSLLIGSFILAIVIDQHNEKKTTDFFAFEYGPNSAEIVGPISIDGNSDFGTQAIANNWTGDGSFFNPYIIQNYIIVSSNDSTSAISIANTNVYFIIRNCTLTASGATSSGIYFDSVYNGQVENVQILNATNMNFEILNSINITIKDSLGQNSEVDGINLDNSTYCTIFNNTIENCQGMGYFSIFCDNNNVSQNHIINNDGTGLYLWASSNNWLEKNRAEQNGYEGIYLQADSHNTTLQSNLFIYNSEDGISVQSDNNTLFNNTIIGNNKNGILLSDANLNDVLNNSIEHNVNWGIFIDDSNNTEIYGNIFRNNSFGGVGISQLTDSNTIISNDFYYNHQMGIEAFSNSSNNLFDNNWWAKWLQPDNNSNGIVDLSYLIDGPANISDNNPRTQPFNLKYTWLYHPTLENILPNPSSSGNITLIWNNITGSSEYEVLRSTSPIIVKESAESIANVSALTYNDIRSSNGTYWYSIIAKNNDIESILSTSKSVTVNLYQLVLSNPILSTLTGNNETRSVTLNWTAVTGATGYLVYRSTSVINDTQQLSPIANVTSLSYIDNLGIDGTYYYVIIANNGTINSSASNMESIIIQHPSNGTTGNDSQIPAGGGESGQSNLNEWLPYIILGVVIVVGAATAKQIKKITGVQNKQNVEKKAKKVQEGHYVTQIMRSTESTDSKSVKSKKKKINKKKDDDEFDEFEPILF